MNTRSGNGRLAVLAIGMAAVGAIVGGGFALAQTVSYPPGGMKLPSWSEMRDWDGVWERGGDMVWDDRIPVGASQDPPYNEQYKKLAAQTPPVQRFARPGQPVVQAPAAAPAAGGRAGGGRVAAGMPTIMTPLRPLEVQVNPHEVLITSEQGNTRRIYTDGRLHPADPIPSAAGHSIGYWKNKELFVDTCCMMENTRLPGDGPHSDAMHITEHFYSPKHGMLVDEITVEDPKAFTKPWSTVKTFYRRPDWELLPQDLAGGGGGGGGGAPPAPGK
jgi:hypothetical protein